MPNVTWTRDTAAHLLRRAGFGTTRAELDRYTAMGLDAAVASLVDYQSVSNAELDAILAEQNFDFDRPGQVQQWWLLRMLYTARPLEEKMAFFWHNYFATSVDKVPAYYMKAQNDTFRANALPNFRDMLLAMSRDPAMILWLDNDKNRARRPNENYARELLELFSMGEGNGYTETDIKEIARCFTGWTVRGEDGYVFIQGTHDDGSKQFLNTSIAAGGGEADGGRVCDVVAARPETAKYVVRRLLEAFVHAEPSQATVAKFAAVYTSSSFSIREVMRAILRSDEFYSDEARFGTIKSPTEFAVGSLKALASSIDARKLGNEIEGMGQTLLAPPDVGGWDGELTWINTTTMLARGNFGNALATNRDDRTPPRGHKIDVDALLAGQTFTKAKKLVDYFLDLLGPIELTVEQKKPLKNYLVRDDAGVKRPFVLDATMKDTKIRGLIHLIMSLPEYNLN